MAVTFRALEAGVAEAGEASSFEAWDILELVRLFAFAWLLAGGVSFGSVQLLVPIGFVIAGTAWRRTRRSTPGRQVRRAAGVQMLIWTVLLGSFPLAAAEADTAARVVSAVCLAALTAHGAVALGDLARRHGAGSRRFRSLEFGALLVSLALISAGAAAIVDADEWGTALPVWIPTLGLTGLVVLWVGYGQVSAALRGNAKTDSTAG